MKISPGDSVGRYHILEPLGEGGMAAVFKAYDTRLEREVAIKFLRTELFGEAVLEQLFKRFEREAKVLARMAHFHIVKIYDYGEHEGAPYLVMEYVPGGTLKSRLGRPIPWAEAVELLLPVARALEYAHQRGVLHRDIKPSNVLITEGGEPLLSDFGIAKILETGESQAITSTGVGIGTPEYMAPEQGLAQPVDGRTDVYALGVVLYEMLTGRKPYTADTPTAVLIKQIHDPLPNPRESVPGLPFEVEKVLLKALAKQPEFRYSSMSEMVKAMENLLRPPAETGQSTTIAAEWHPKVEPAVEELTDLLAATQIKERPAPEQSTQADKEKLPSELTPEGKPAAAAVSEARKLNFKWWLLAPILVVVLIGIGLVVWQPWSGKLPANVPTNVHKICQVTDDGGIDDKSFNAAAWKGVEDAKDKFGIEVKYLESRQKADYEKNISLLIQENCDLIITVGSMLGDTTLAMAQANPDQKFSIVDYSSSPDIPNVLAQVFTTDQAAFLAGYVAAATTKTGKVATFGGMQILPVTAFMDGFWYGVKYYNDQKGADVTVLGWNPATQTGIFAGNFESLDDGYGLGLGFLNEGVDIILPVAGPVGQGTAAAVKDHGNAWIIGVDTDWTKSVPKFKRVILTSILKNMDATTFDAIEMVINGNFHGGVLSGELANNGVDIAPVASASMTYDLQAELETIRAGIIAGTIQTRP